MTSKVAVIGVGRMGRRHLQAVRALDVEIVGIADTDEASLGEAALLAPAARRYRDFEDLLRQEDVDLLCVATTSPAHEAIVAAAAEAGVRSILCEKPLATSLAAGRRMIEACGRAGTRLVVNHSRRLFEPYVAVRAALAQDVFGDVRAMHVTCGAAGLANIGTHAFDLMTWFCGAPTSVAGYVDPSPIRNARGPQFHDPGGSGVIRFEDDRRATFDFTADFCGGFTVQISCRYGRILLREDTRELQAVARAREGRAAPMSDYGVILRQVPLPFSCPVDIVAMTASMIAHSLSGDPPVCGGRDALTALEMAAAVHVSDAEGHRPIPLPLTDDRGTLERIA